MHGPFHWLALQDSERSERKMLIQEPGFLTDCEAKEPFYNVRRPMSSQALGQWRRSKKHADDALSFPARSF